MTYRHRAARPSSARSSSWQLPRVAEPEKTPPPWRWPWPWPWRVGTERERTSMSSNKEAPAAAAALRLLLLCKKAIQLSKAFISSGSYCAADCRVSRQREMWRSAQLLTAVVARRGCGKSDGPSSCLVLLPTGLATTLCATKFCFGFGSVLQSSCAIWQGDIVIMQGGNGTGQ